MPSLSSSGRSQDEIDGARRALPFLTLRLEAFEPEARDSIVPCAAVVLRRPPLRRDQSAPEESLERRVECPLVDREDVAGELLDALADPPAVRRLEGEGLEHEHLERPRNDLG